VSAGILVLLAASAVLIVVSAQRARRLADRQLDFVAGVSHELRTPLAVIGSAAENLADGVVTEPGSVRQYGRVIRDEGRRLGEMVEQVLDLAGTYSGRRALHAEDVVVGEILDEAVRAAGASFPSLRLDTTVEPDLPILRADRAALVRAVRNLVENAAKHGGESAPVAIRAARARSSGRDEVRLTVEDRGPGIPPEERPYLFEPFFRGRRAREGQVRGSGLGLSLVDRIVRAAGGRVEVASDPGRGAAFTIVLPVLSAASSPASAGEPSHGTPNPAR
jgi:signal transduction histidine kinase